MLRISSRINGAWRRLCSSTAGSSGNSTGPVEMTNQRLQSAMRIAKSEDCYNDVTLIGRVWRDAELKGSADRPIVAFTICTHTKGQPIADFHRILVHNPVLRSRALQVRQNDRIMVNGRLFYFRVSGQDSNLVMQQAKISANEIVNLSRNYRAQSDEGIDNRGHERSGSNVADFETAESGYVSMEQHRSSASRRAAATQPASDEPTPAAAASHTAPADAPEAASHTEQQPVAARH